MAGAGKKTFTAGEILTASDTNTYLMEQTVMYFAGTAARASAIPTPSTGMTTYIGVTGTATIPQIETYTGSAWQTPYGMTLIANADFTSASTVSFDNVFSATYDRYKIVGTITTATGAFYLNYKLRSGGADLTNNYANNVTSQAADNLHNNSTTSAGQWTYYNITDMCFEADVMSPFLTAKTWAVGMSYYNNSTDTFGTQYTQTTSCTGISIFPNANAITGNIKIYGYRNS